PAHPYTRALMACRPEVAARHAAFPVIAGQVPSPGQWPDGCRFASRCRWADTACERPVAEDAWHEGSHRARCVHVERVRQASRNGEGVSA
ncbi:MAG TPA: oligopeptide/dipeptide ABC transporter ATP-binding protein, partial [Mariprofundaceae bacterium]|nr:oligopeptide/dipeptide ABC transporter ATP-binding protein [Mariprofundaceae bacterium]